MSRRKKKPVAQTIESDELGAVIQEETGISLSDLHMSDEASDSPRDIPKEAIQQETTPVTSVRAMPSSETETSQGLHVTNSHEEEDTEELLSMADEYEKESAASRIVPVVIGLLLAVVLIGSIISGIIVSRLLDAKNQAEIARKSFASFQLSINNLDFRSALEEFPKGHAAIEALKKRVGELQFATWVPWIGSSIHETYDALGVLDRIFTSGEQLLALVSKMGTIIFRHDSGKTFELYMRTLSIDEKGALLKMISQSIPMLNGAQATLQLAARDSVALDQTKLSSQLRDALIKAREGANEIGAVITAWLPLAEVVPSFLGYPDEKTYLILLQDTSELRATGGFISHYGILKIHNGEITELRTDNVYNLDDRGEHLVSLPPPAPVGQYFSKSIKKWFFRDANWAPDFSVSARQAEGLYHLEGGSQENIDGVLAATPELVRSLLRFTGPIRIEGREYSADTMLEQLAFEVREGNYRRGITEVERKEIFGQLIAKMGERLLDIPLTRWTELYKIVQSRLDEKNLLVYFHDQELEDYARARNWTGEIRQTTGDFLFVNDTTLGTLKTESVMDKKVRYTLREDPDGFLVGRVELTYKNNGTFSDVTTRYRDWVRIMVPAGSTLIESSGAQPPEDQQGDGTLEITQEHGTMQFGAYITVEPRYTKVFTLDYRLPDRIYDTLKNTHTYSLLLQKQPGNSHTRFEGNLMFLTPVVEYSPFGFFNARRFAQNLDIFSDLRTDQEFTVRVEKEGEK